MGQVVLSGGKRFALLKTQLAVCMCKQNPALAGLGFSPIDFGDGRIDYHGRGQGRGRLRGRLSGATAKHWRVMGWLLHDDNKMF